MTATAPSQATSTVPYQATSQAVSFHPSMAPSPLNGCTRLTHLGVIELAGEDAAKFIHGQLTHDFSLLGPDKARLAAFCSAKGRMLASFIGIKPEPQRILLVCSQDLLGAMVKRLSMFVLRAKVRVRDASGEFALWGLAGDAVDPTLAARPVWSVAANSSTPALQCWEINLYPADGVARQMLLHPVAAGAASVAPHQVEIPLETWAWGEVRSGIAMVSAPLSDMFVPQMLNYESVDGVNFKKGCYPGQEVVARSQFRGTLKRRAFVLEASAPLGVGDEIFTDADLAAVAGSADPAQPVGIVAQAAPNPLGVDATSGHTPWSAIASLQLSALEGATLRARGADGPTLKLLALPYPLLNDI